MPRATCRCGQRLSFPADGPERVICPNCQARIRIRRPGAADEESMTGGGGASGLEQGDGFLRFACPCGRRLKLRDTNPRPEAGRCPDCGRIVPVPVDAVPSRGSGDPEAPTVDMDANDFAELARWAETYKPKAARTPASAPSPAHAGGTTVTEPEPATEPAPAAPAPVPIKVEVGLRVCPRCGRPVHMSAETCRHCGAHVPKR